MSTRKLVNSSAKAPQKSINKQLKVKTQQFLSCRTKSEPLVFILHEFEKCIAAKNALTPYLLAVEQIFSELLISREMVLSTKPTKTGQGGAFYNREALRNHYENTWKLILNGISSPDESDSTQALVTAMHILCTEAKYPKNPDSSTALPSSTKLRAVVQKLLSPTRLNTYLFARFKEFGAYLDIVFSIWKILPDITVKTKNQTDIYIQNYLELINAIPISAEVQENKQIMCYEDNSFDFDYPAARKNLNKVWACIMQWTENLAERTHKQMLVILLEKVLNHLDRPILLTDFLMDSLDVGGPVSLLALQGVFTLIQQHNLTYPQLYEKLYSMFEPEIFHTKYKSRLFYLADIFLSSSHLPENLVAAFAKRLARLALVAPAQDITVIIYFIGNLIVRHPGLKRLISWSASEEVPRDPFMMDERNPLQSNALDSSLWEIASLQEHAIPSVAQASKLVSNPPRFEWNLSSLLDIDENDVFDQEILKRSKEYALKFEGPPTAFVDRDIDSFSRHWSL